MLDVVPNQIVQCFTLYHDTVCAVLDKDNSRLLQTVVVGGHGVVVCAGCANGNGVTDFAMLDGHVLADEVAALAALSGDGDLFGLGLSRLVCNQCVLYSQLVR